MKFLFVPRNLIPDAQMLCYSTYQIQEFTEARSAALAFANKWIHCPGIIPVAIVSVSGLALPTTTRENRESRPQSAGPRVKEAQSVSA